MLFFLLINVKMHEKKSRGLRYITCVTAVNGEKPVIITLYRI